MNIDYDTVVLITPTVKMFFVFFQSFVKKSYTLQPLKPRVNSWKTFFIIQVLPWKSKNASAFSL